MPDFSVLESIPGTWGLVDTKVGDMLANIRKAVDHDIDSIALPSTNAQSRGTLMRGVLREMRVSMTSDTSVNSVREEIETLRDRIKRKGEAASLLGGAAAKAQEPVQKPQTPPALVKAEAPVERGPFSGILAGTGQPRQKQTPLRSERPPVLRPSLAEEDHFSARYPDNGRYPADPQAGQWPDDDAYGDDNGHAHYAGPRHYHDRVADDANYPLLAPPLMSAHAEAATESAFRHLSEALIARATSEHSMEDMTRDILRSHIKQWLDANLPALVEELVREEIERVARKGR